MATLTKMNTRTITGYLVTLLEYPRWLIDREVDFTDCHLHGDFGADDEQCRCCEFGSACRWLNQNRSAPSPGMPLPDLIHALQTAVNFVRNESLSAARHERTCDCDTCKWLREANRCLRAHRHHKP